MTLLGQIIAIKITRKKYLYQIEIIGDVISHVQVHGI